MRYINPHIFRKKKINIKSIVGNNCTFVGRLPYKERIVFYQGIVLSHNEEEKTVECEFFDRNINESNDKFKMTLLAKQIKFK